MGFLKDLFQNESVREDPAEGISVDRCFVEEG